MNIHSRLIFIPAFCLLIILSCSKPVDIGSEFLDDQKASLNFVDYFDLTFFTEVTDSIIVHSDNTSRQLITYLCGQIEEPFFGKSTTDIYAQPLLPGVATALQNALLDSVVLQLRYDTLGTYGDLSQPVTLEVYRMLENPAFKANYYSNQRFLTSGDLLGSLTFMPKPKDSVTIYHPNDTTTIAPCVRIPLDVLKMNEITLQDNATLSNQDSFKHYFNGLYIKMTGANNTMLGFKLVNSVSGLSFYYDKDPLMDQEFRFVFTAGGVKTVHMEHDYSGSVVEGSLTADPEMDYFYIQGMSGVRTKMRLEGLDTLGEAIINQAQIEFFCTIPPGDMADLYPPLQYSVSQAYDDEDGIVNSEDVMIALGLTGSSSTSESFNFIYGGKLSPLEVDPPEDVYRYNMNVTLQVKSIYKGEQENIIYFNPFAKGNLPGRSVIFGPDHPTYAPRLRVAYTKINK